MNSLTLQDRISPPAQPIARNISDAKVSDPSGAVDSNGGNSKVDFQSVLTNANTGVQKERQAKSGSDLSSAKNYEDFLEKLSANRNSDRVPKNTLEKDDFLKLFITQLQNQDPLKPQDGAEMASQLAQFNSVEQMMNVNKGLERLEKAQATSQAVNYLNYIGKEVAVSGGRVKFDDAGIGDVKFSLERPVTASTLEVRDMAGQLVATKELGSISAGNHQLQWDGLAKDGAKLPSGNYSFSITATDIGGAAVPADITSKVKVTGVDMGSENAEFYTTLGKLKFRDIAAIGDKGFSAGMQAAPEGNATSPQPASAGPVNDQRPAAGAEVAGPALGTTNPALQTQNPPLPNKEEAGNSAPAKIKSAPSGTGAEQISQPATFDPSSPAFAGMGFSKAVEPSPKS